MCTANDSVISGVQYVQQMIQLYIYVLFFRFFSLIGSYRILSMILCAIHYVLVLYLFYMCVCSVTQLCLTPCDPIDCTLPGFSVHGLFFRREHWSGLPFPPSGDLPDTGIEP